MKIGIITPTYNRKHTLVNLYESLCKQNDKNFEWIIIDDGSTDNTRDYVKKIKQKAPFTICYKYQENKGKIKALNFAFTSFIDYFDIFVIVDSDDILLENAIESIENVAGKYVNSKQVGALFFRYKLKNGAIIQTKNDNLDIEIIMNRSEHDDKYGKYDGCVAYYNRVIKEYQYPEFENEKYMGPTVLQLLMEEKYKIFFSNKVVGIAEYQQDGLTKSGRQLRLNNPQGMAFYSFLRANYSNKLQLKIKYFISAGIYLQILKVNKNEIFRELIKLNVSTNNVFVNIGKVIGKLYFQKGE